MCTLILVFPVNNFYINDTLKKIANKASKLVNYNKRPILTAREIQTSVRLVLPEKIGKRAVSSGTEAFTKFANSEAGLDWITAIA